MIEEFDCGISHIVLWELAKLRSLNRIQIELDDHELQIALNDLIQWPVAIEVCRATLKLNFRSDPADEIIAATSICYDIPLLTRDKKIRASKVVPLAL